MKGLQSILPKFQDITAQKSELPLAAMGGSRLQPSPTTEEAEKQAFLAALKSRIFQRVKFGTVFTKPLTVPESLKKAKPEPKPEQTNWNEKEWRSMPLGRTTATVERVNVMRASLGLSEMSLDDSLFLRNRVGSASSGRDSASSTYSHPQRASADSQHASGDHEAATPAVRQNLSAHPDYPPRSPWSEQRP
jgi:hypothetical protein